jgi:hypothetical protein
VTATATTASNITFFHFVPCVAHQDEQRPNGTGVNASTLRHQHPAPPSSTPEPSPSQPPSDRGEEHPTPRSVLVSAPAPPQTEASIPSSAHSLGVGSPVVLVLLYAISHLGSSPRNVRRTRYQVPPAQREVVVVGRRKTPRLPSARDLLRKLT